MSYFSENIKYLRNKQGISQEALAIELDVTRSKIASYEDARAQPSLETLVAYSGFFGLPIDVMLKNDLTRSQDGTFINIGQHRILFPVLINEQNQDLIEVVSMQASAGYLAGYGDPEYVATLPMMQLPFVPTGKHRAFPIKGDSMEPWVKEGAFVIGRFLEDFKLLNTGKTYIVVTREDGLSYKRLYSDRIEEGWLTLKSDNPIYSPYDVHLNEILELWEYTCKIDMQDYALEDLNINSIANMMRSFQIELKEIKERL